MKEKKLKKLLNQERDRDEHTVFKIATIFRPREIKSKTEKKLRKKPSWKAGFKAGKKGLTLDQCPYKLDEETWKILRKRARWLRGYQEAFYVHRDRSCQNCQNGKKKHRKSK